MDNIFGVSLSDYQLAGPGEMSASDFSDLQKALEAGSTSGLQTLDSTSSSGAPLKVESLENTLKLITFKESDIVLWKEIPKLPAYNTVEEYNQLTSYGSDRGGFYNEGELPENEDATYVRRAQLVKFMGVTKSVTHPMQLVNTMVGNMIQRETMNGTLHVLRTANKAIWKGNADIITQEFNGLLKQQQDAFTSLATWNADTVVIDANNHILTEDHIQAASLAIIENYGEGSMLMAPPSVLTNFVKNYTESKFIQPNTPAVTNGFMGQKVEKFMSQFGAIDLKYDKFMKEGSVPKYTTTAATSSKAPTAPTAVSQAVATDTSNKFGATYAGDYWYAVSAVNRYGESVLTALSGSKLTIASTESANLKFTDGGGTYAATGYNIYRTKADPSTAQTVTPFYKIFSISTAQLAAGFDGGSATYVYDRNRFIAATESCFLIQPDTEVYSFKQLAPLMKMDLAVLSPAIRMMILLYGTAILYCPKKMSVIINIGESTT